MADDTSFSLNDTPQETTSPETPPVAAAGTPEVASIQDSTSPLDKPTDARLAGYGWPEIDGHLADARQTAEQFGYSPAEVNAHLGYADPDALSHDLQSSARMATAAADEGTHPLEAASGGILTPSSNPDFPVKVDDLTADQRTDYANALLTGTTKGPQDFAQSLTDAVSATSGHDAGPATQAIAAQLPDAKAATDYAIGIAQTAGLSTPETPNPDAVKAVRQNMLNVWAQTGMTPKDIYNAAHSEPAFIAAILNPPAPPPITFPTLEELGKPGRDAIGHGGIVGGLMNPLEGIAGLRYLPQEEYENTAKVAGLIKQNLHPPEEGIAAVPTAGDIFSQMMESPSLKLIASILAGRAIGSAVEVLPNSAIGNSIKSLMTDESGQLKPERAQVAGELTVSALLRSTIRQETLPESLDAIIKETESPLNRVITETNLQAAKRVTAERGAMAAQLREIMGDTSYTKATARQALEGFFSAVNQQVPSYLDWMKDYQGQMQATANEKQAWIRGGGDPSKFSATDPTSETGQYYHPLQVLYDHILNRPGGGRVSPDDPLYPAAETISKLMIERMDTLDGYVKDGGTGFLMNYFPKLWADSPIRVKQQFRDLYGGKSTTVPTIFEGIDRGLTPKFPNPIEGSLHFIQAVDDYTATQRAKEWMLSQGAAYKAKGPQNEGDFLLKNSGNLYAPRGYAKVFNHWADKGFDSWPTGGLVYRKWLMAKNATLALSLGLSGFHPIAISMQMMASQFGRSIGNVAHGEILRALGNVGLGALTMAGVNQAVKFRKGQRLQNAYMDDPRATPVEKELMGIYKQAGGKAPSEGRGEPYWASQARNLFDDWKRAGSWNLGPVGRGALQAAGAIAGGAAGAALLGPAGALPGAAIGRMAPVVPTLFKSTWNDTVAAFKGKKGEPVAQHIALPIPRFAEAIAGNFGRVADTLTAPLFDNFIPKVKMAVWADTMEDWLRHNPTADRTAVVRAGRQTMDSMDDRFGEMNLDNIFWNPYLKQLANCAFLSIGWEYGTWRAAGRGVEDLLLKPEGKHFTTRMNVLLGSILAAGLAAGTYQYLMTGTGPSPMNFAGVAKSGTPAGNIEIPFETKEFDRMYSLVVRAGNSPVKWLQIMPAYVLGKVQFGIAKDVKDFLEDPGKDKLVGKLLGNHTPIGVSTMTPNLPYIQTLMGIHSAPPEWGGAKATTGKSTKSAIDTLRGPVVSKETPLQRLEGKSKSTKSPLDQLRGKR